MTNDHLQLIKLWPYRAPEKGVCGGAKIFGSSPPYCVQPARSVCVSSERFFISFININSHVICLLDVITSSAHTNNVQCLLTEMAAVTVRVQVRYYQ